MLDASAAPARKGPPTMPRAYRPTQADLANAFQRQKDYDGLVRQPLFKASIEPHWFAGDTRFWYRNDGPQGRREFILVDAARGVRQPAFDHAKLAVALSRAVGQTYPPEFLPFDAIAYTDDGKFVQFTADGQDWQCDLASYACTKQPIGAAKPTGKLGEQTKGAEEKDAGKQTEAKPIDAPHSPGELVAPDGRWTAFVRDHDVWVRSQNSTETRLSRIGTSERFFGGLHWSPDSQRLAGFQITPVAIPDVFMVESSPKEGFRGVLHRHEYAQPGDPFPIFAPWIFDPVSATATPVSVDPINFGEERPDLQWRADGRRFLYEKTDRGHQRFRVLQVDTRTGQTQTIIDERAQTFINTSRSYTHYTEGAAEIIYASEQDGWRHLYLYDSEQGGLKNQITRGPWVVREVDRVDEAARQIWFQASGKNPGEDPYHIHFYRINFDGTGLVALTEGNGTHSVQYSPSRTYLIDTYSRADLPPVHTLRRVADGAQVCALETADVSHLSAVGWKPPQVFTAKGRDGQTDIWGVVFRPLTFDPKNRYPVIENIYAGPQDSFVRKSFAVRDAMQSLAELGFIVVQCDGMGTRNRSKAFHDVCWRNLKDAGLPDRIAWIKALAKRDPAVDTRRVGIYGTSAGGQSSTGALLFHPEFYKVAVSSCGCHDNRIDKRWWNEQWMGYPVGPWYAESSNIVHADKLRGKLFLMVGELDTNVPPESTLRLADALIKAGKDFDLLVLPSQDHGSGGSYGERRRRDYFIRHLLGVDPPDCNAPQPHSAPVSLPPYPPAATYLARGDAGEETSVVFRNETEGPVELFWLMGDGGRKSYGTLSAHGTRDMHTYAGHAWLVTDAGGNPLSIFVGEARPGIAEIRSVVK